MSYTVVPAYGRDYKSAKAALADWNADKDFKIASVDRNNGLAINRSQAVADKLEIWIRYDRLTKKVKAT